MRKDSRGSRKLTFTNNISRERIRDKELAKDFATNGDENNGILLKKDFPKSVLIYNLSPDRYNEGPNKNGKPDNANFYRLVGDKTLPRWSV